MYAIIISAFSICMIVTLIKIKMKSKNSSPRDDINRPRPRYGHRYTNNIKSALASCCLYINQHLSNICSSILVKVKQHCGTAEKTVAYEKGV